MQITQEEQLSRDFDWFCVDEIGELGHFASAGFKNLPATVSFSAEDLALVTNYFLNKLPTIGTHSVDKALSLEIPDPTQRGDRYLRSFAAMADKGLFSYDIESHLKPDIHYFRVALPQIPIRSSDLPQPIRIIVERTRLKNRQFRNSSRIPYKDLA